MSSVSLTTLTARNAPDWNEAYVRLHWFLSAYRVAHPIYLHELTYKILEQAIESQADTPALSPTSVTLSVARKMLQNWFGTILNDAVHDDAVSRSQLMSMGHIALLLSQAPQEWPTSFLSMEIPASLQASVKQSLMVTGPTLDVSSMTPRVIDYGPMLQIAQQTWHHWDVRRMGLAFSFWALVYVLVYLTLYIALYRQYPWS